VTRGGEHTKSADRSRKGGSAEGRELFVDVSARADGEDEHAVLLGVNVVDDTVVAHAEPVQAGEFALEGCDAGRTERIRFQFLDGLSNLTLMLRIKPSIGLLGARVEEDLKHGGAAV